MRLDVRHTDVPRARLLSGVEVPDRQFQAFGGDAEGRGDLRVDGGDRDLRAGQARMEARGGLPEAADRLTSVHTAHGTFDVDLSLAAIETSLGRTFARVHRNWLVNAEHIKQLDREGSETTIFVGAAVGGGPNGPSGLMVPVARERAQGVREMLLANATGVRRP